MILAAQFESLRDPLTIMLTVPMAVTGAVLSLHWFGQSLNVFSQIGIITLVGLITKNGILIVEFANHLKDTGLSNTKQLYRQQSSDSVYFDDLTGYDIRGITYRTYC